MKKIIFNVKKCQDSVWGRFQGSWSYLFRLNGSRAGLGQGLKKSNESGSNGLDPSPSLGMEKTNPKKRKEKDGDKTK